MVEWKIVYTKIAQKDSKKLISAKLDLKAKKLLNMMKNDPFTNPPPFEKLIGDLSGTYSKRINIQHRLIYQVFEDQKIIKVIRMWSHYE